MNTSAYLKIFSISGIILSCLGATNTAPFDEFRKENGKTQLDPYIKMNTSALPSVVKVPIGKPLELYCSVFATPAPVSNWLHNGRVITDTILDVDRNSGLIVNLVNKLYIEHVKLHHAGEYVCSAYTYEVKPVTSKTVKVIVVDNADVDDDYNDMLPKAPVIAQYYKHITQDCLQDVILPCVPLGSEEMRVSHWTMNEQMIHSRKHPSPRYEVLDNGFLHIRKLRWADMGNYECHVESPFGTDKKITFVYPMGEEECSKKE